MAQANSIEVSQLAPMVRKIALNRPAACNAFDEQMIATLIEELQRADADPQARVIVITGAGAHFCAGGDVKAMASRAGMFAGAPNELRERYQRGIQQIPLTIERLETPLIAMVNGPAVGAGCDLACMCDLRYASETAFFAESFAQVGLVPGDGGTYFLGRIVGYARAMEMILTAKRVAAKEAKEMNLVHEVLPPEQLEARVLEVALKVASLPPVALRLAKKAMKQLWQDKLWQQLDLLAAYQGISQRTDDHFEALAAMREGRKGDFQGL